MCPATRCTYGSTGHVTKAYVSDSNQFKIYIESEVRIFWVYGDFSATLYIVFVAIYLLETVTGAVHMLHMTVSKLLLLLLLLL